MGSFDNLDRFELASHGDHREQQWASVVIEHFPAYEIFWRRYVVPLTNRINPRISFPRERDKWIRIRDDVRDRHEQMAMHHYSVFYYLGRAIHCLRPDEAAFPEDVFALLDACGDNVRAFLKVMRSILGDFGKPYDFLPVQKNELCCARQRPKSEILRGAFVEVQAYRDAILHNPVLGRGVDVSREFLPRREFLDMVKLSWREAALLKPGQRIDSRLLYSRLHGEVTSFLQETWETLIGRMDDLRETDKFKKQWTLDEQFLPIASPPAVMAGSTSQPLAASGIQAISCSHTAAMPVRTRN